jgi:hypothetical protein
MDEIIVELRTRVTTLTPKEGAEKLETLAFMQKVYDENAHVPTWPLDWKMILRFASAQALPVISLIASGGPVLDIAKKVLGLF